jgi:hypothetical protein
MVKKFLLLGVLIFIPASSFAASESLYVKVREAKVRAEPKQWAPSVASLKYGDRVSVVSEDGAWLKLSSGYLHSTAVSERKVILEASKSVNKGGDDKDVILAGKGFNKEVENSYAAKNRNLNYGEVDKMERVKVGDRELASFVGEGRLQGGK